ncbi:TCP-1/cpn60 chaperonin family protein [Haloplanus litoreus]|uniref:TCP-1/cpn60 chaperonin family protein n=1 Tax=Haloplanus litoreus TaxID=767515 RepID=UPI0036114521
MGSRRRPAGRSSRSSETSPRNGSDGPSASNDARWATRSGPPSRAVPDRCSPSSPGADGRGGAPTGGAIEDALETAATAAIDGQVVPGAGAPAAAVAAAIRDGETSVAGREQLAVGAFADAVERLPAVLARNAGHDPVTAVTDLRTAHATEGESSVGLSAETGAPVDAWEAGIVEPRRVFSQAIETAAAIVEQLLTIDTVLYPNVELYGYTPRPERE